MMNFRPANEKDFDAVYRLVCQLEETAFDENDFRQVFSHALKCSDVFLACDQDDENMIYGYVVLSRTWQLHHCGKVAEIVELCVDEQYRNMGIGTELLKYAENVSIQSGCVMMDITTNRKRTDAHRFYERNGYTQSHYKYTKPL